MNDLQRMIAGIVNDVISARFQADAVAAEYSKLYREDEFMRHMATPMLNIRNVAVDLRMAFAPPDEEQESTSTSAANQALEAQVVEEASVELRDRLFNKFSVASSDLSGARLAGAKNAVRSAIGRAMEDDSIGSSVQRKAAVNEAIVRQLAKRNIDLSERDRQTLSRDIDGFSTRLATAKAVADAEIGQRKIITDSDSLASVNPEAISSIKFEIDLEEMRWVDIDESVDGVTEAKLTEG